MPRGRKKSTQTVAEQIAEIDRQISELQEKKKGLLDLQEQNAIKQLLDAAKAAGKSPMELVAELTK